MEAPDHTVEEIDGYYVVRVSKDVADYVFEDALYPGRWVIEDVDDQITGLSKLREKAAAFLATWFTAEELDWI